MARGGERSISQGQYCRAVLLAMALADVQNIGYFWGSEARRGTAPSWVGWSLAYLLRHERDYRSGWAPCVPKVPTVGYPSWTYILYLSSRHQQLAVSNPLL